MFGSARRHSVIESVIDHMESRSAPRLHQDFHSAIKASRFLTAVYIGVGAVGQSFTGEAIRSAFAATSEETMPISKKLTRLSYARWTPRPNSYFFGSKKF